jgi:peptide/nickel transport system substrate-binding protein
MLVSQPVLAQKSKDTLRHVQQDSIASVDEWIDPRPEVEFNADNAYDNIVGFDPVKHEYVGILAKSWRRVDPQTLEFDLHDNVTWSDGEKFTADDVVYTFNWVLNPDTKLRFREAYTWIAKVEKLGPYKVRIISKAPIPWDLARLSTQSNIMPKHVHEKLEDKQDFGRAPVGTGPYRYIQVDKNTGLVAVKRDYPQASSAKPAPTIGKLVVTFAADVGTMTALILAGQVDIARNIPADQAAAIEAGGQYKRVIRESQGSQYLMIDTVGRSGKKELTDPRVREAIMAAIDTNAYITIAFGENSGVNRPKALCSDTMVGCAHSLDFVKYDPARAKQLLAESGHADGFDVVITALDGSQRQIAQIMAGQLRAVGIRASIELNAFAT